MDKSGFGSIEEYIATCAPKIQKVLEEVRATIRAAAPQAEEKISYQIPTFFLKGNLVHFAAFTNHIGFFPTSSGIEAFKQELSNYRSSKGAVQFPLDQPMPLDLISKITKFRVAENLERAQKKSKQK